MRSLIFTAIPILIIYFALFFVTQPAKSRPTFNEDAINRVLESKSQKLLSALEPILHPQTLNQDRNSGNVLRPQLPAEKYIYALAPRLWWHSEEQQGPTDPLYFIHHSELFFWRGEPWLPGLAKERKKMIALGEIDPRVLAKEYGGINRRPLEAGGMDSGLSGYYLKYDGSNDLLDNFSPLLWRVSRHSALEAIQDKNPNSIILLIEYWYQSVHNPTPVYLGSHEGDWESFGLLTRFEVSEKTSELSAQLLAVYFSQHTHGDWQCADKLEYDKNNTDGTKRLNLYSALGTHATYPHVGTGKAGLLPDYTERSREWKSWDWLTPLQLEPYYGYTGAWGKASLHWSMTGPMPPAPQYKYLPNATEIPKLPCQL